MAREIPYIQALGEAVHQEMARDDSVIYFGQNLGLTDDDPYVKAFGGDRVRVTPISETAEIGMAVGAAFAGFPPGRPALHVRVHARRDGPGRERGPPLLRHERRRGEGAARAPGRLRVHSGLGGPAHRDDLRHVHGRARPQGRGAVHAGRREGADDGPIRDDNPVVLFHSYLLTLEHGDVPEGEHVVPLGEAVTRREGGDVTIVGIGWTVGMALAAAEQLAADGVEAEVIDPRTLAPLDTAAIIRSVEKTGRLVIVDQATRHASAAAVIAAEVASEGFSALKAPIGLVTALDATIPYSQPMEEYLMPSEERIVAAVQQAVGSSPVAA